MAAVENNPPPMDAGGAEEERRFASSSVHATILEFLLIALIFVPIKITLDVEAAREKAREDFALKFMDLVELLLVVAILLKETPAGAYLIQQKRLYDLRKLREAMATAQAEVAQAELNVVEMQEPAGEEAIAVQKSVQLAVVRRQVAAAAVAAGVAQEIPNEIP